MWLCSVFVLLLLSPVSAQQVNPRAAPASPEPIPLTQITLRFEELSHTLREILHGVPADSELEALAQELRVQAASVDNGLRRSEELLTGSATLMEIREQLRNWRAYGSTETRQRKILGAWGAACERSLKLLDIERAAWEVTLKNTKERPEFKRVLTHIRAALTDIRAAKTTAERRFRAVLDLQARLSKEALAIADVVEKLNTSRHEVRAQLLQPDAPPIWRAQPDAPADPIQTVLTRSLSRSYSGAVAFVIERQALVSGAVCFLVLAVIVLHRISRNIIRAGVSDEAVNRLSRVLRRPLSLAVLIAVPFLLSYPLARVSTVLVLSQLSLLPIVRLLPLFTSQVRAVYCFAVFFAMNGLVAIFDANPHAKREVLGAIFGFTVCVLLWRGRPAWLRRAGAAEGIGQKEVLLARWSLLVVASVLIANVLGFLLLSQLLRLATLLCTCYALVLYTLVKVTDTLFVALLRLPRVSSLASVRMHETGLVIWVARVVTLGAVLCWLYTTLRLFDIRDPVFEAVAAVLNARPGIRGLDFSIGDVLGFIGVLLFGFLLAGGLRFVLREEILPCWRLSRGVPETISTSFYYVALLFVFLMSLNAIGVDLDKLTVLTGAIGVGLGFGLQNIVNNFVSGLILQFERPIRVGDALEVGELGGEVRHIGIRASTIRTWQGAEVIIPNSTFISGQVVNWTLSEPYRRVDIPVRVAYGTDPELVIRMLLEISCAHPEVLRTPEPFAVFQGFGESALNFLVMFWAEQSTHFRLRSEISIQIASALRAAGIEIPVPQREIRIRSSEAAALQRHA